MRHGNASRLALAVALFTILPLEAQRGGGGRGGPAQSAQAAAPVDLTGYWVSIVNEDWRFRMVMPAPGDYQGVPMTAEARRVADAWNPAKDEASGDECKAYGAPALLRVPEHLHIAWQDAQTLRLDTDAGKQTRLFHFGDWKAPTGPPALQGDSVAMWEVPARGRGAAPPDPNAPPQGKGSLKVTTTHLKPGYLRKNGVPYSANTVLTEYYDRTNETDGTSYLIVTTIVEDPQYLTGQFITSTHFKKEPDGSKWSPSQCSAK